MKRIKGDGLMLLHKFKKGIDLQQIKAIIRVYLSFVKGKDEKKTNKDIKKEVRRHIENCEDEELVFLLGDFNGHIGIL